MRINYPGRVLVAALSVAIGASAMLGRAAAEPKPAAPLTAILTGSAAGAGIDKIKHVVVIDQENRSFDEYFGMYPGADGIPVDGNGVPTVCVPDPAKGTCVKPFHDPADSNFGGPHGYDASVTDVDNGLMDGFINRYEIECQYKFTRACGGRGLAVPDLMGYKLRSDIPNYWAYADNFVLQDHMFEPLGSYSLPSHLSMLSGWSAKCSVTGDPLSCRNEPNSPTEGAPGKADFAWTDVTYLLHKANVSWGYYLFTGSEPDCEDPNDLTCVPHPQNAKTSGIWNPLPEFDTVAQDGQLGNIQSLTNFIGAAHDGTLPSVSWIIPTASVSEHPQANVSDGQTYVTYMINAIMRSPDWDSTAIFLVWDDWGGFYDHLRPPQIDANGYGIRVPSLVISPYAKQGYIDHQTYSFDAYLHFIEDRFLGGQRLDPANDTRPDYRPDVRENAPQLGDLRNDFDFTQSPRPPVILPTVKSGADLATPLEEPRAGEPTAAAVKAAVAPVTGNAPLTVSFDGSQSSDPGSKIKSWSLNFGDGSKPVKGKGSPPSSINHTYKAIGAYQAVLTLEDKSKATDTAALMVYATNPVARRATWLTGTPINGFAPQTVAFDGSESAPGNWSIDFGDGTADATGSGVPPKFLPHTYTNVGTYIATITITGSDSSVTTASATSSIEPSALPFVRTRAPAQILKTSATFEGHIEPNAATATYWFEYGKTPSLGSKTAVFSVTIGDTFDLVVNGLAPNTQYYYRIVGANSVGTVPGLTTSFTTKGS